MPRRVGYSLLVAFLAAAAAGWWWRHDWPGPHPRAVEQLDQRMAAWNAWLDQRLPDTALPVGNPEELVERLKVLTDPPPDLEKVSSLGSWPDPEPIAGLTVREAIAAVRNREIQEMSQRHVTYLQPYWLTPPDQQFGHAFLSVHRLRKRWWSPTLQRDLHTTSGLSLAQAAENAVRRRIADKTPASVKGIGSITAVGEVLVVQSSARGAAVAEDVFWRIRMEAFAFDLALIAIVAGLLALAVQVAAARYLAQRRLRAGFCRGCGYDLRASPDRCPECGRQAAGVSANP